MAGLTLVILWAAFFSSLIEGQSPTLEPTSVALQPSYVIRYKYLGRTCKANPVGYVVDVPGQLNTCLSDQLVSGKPYKYTCHTGPSGGVTVQRMDFATSDTSCQQPPTRTTLMEKSETGILKCSPPPVGKGGLFTQVGCGPLPLPTASADQLILKQYSDAQCTLQARTSSLIMGHCVPVYGQQRHGLPAQMEYRRKLTFLTTTTTATTTTTTTTATTTSTSTSSPLRVQEQRYVVEDQNCESKTPILVTTLLYYDNLCQADPLSPGRYVKRAMRSKGAAGAALLPHWWGNNQNAPTFVPTSRPPTPRA